MQLPNRLGDLTPQFIILAEKLSALAKNENITIRPFRDAHPEYFPKLPLALQQATLNMLTAYVSVCEEVVHAGHSLKDSAYVLWRMFHKLGVHPSAPDLMTHIGEQDIVEIYNGEFMQVFRSINFFSVCSYTLDELLSRPFWELFSRDESIAKGLLEVGAGLFTKQITGIHLWGKETHTVDEISSEARYHSVVQNQIASPLCDNTGRVLAAIHTFRVVSCERTAKE